MQPDGCRGLCPRTPEVYPLWRYPVEQWKRRHFCRRFPPFYLTACVWSLLSVATFGCIFSIVKNLRDFAFTQFVFQNLLFFNKYSGRAFNNELSVFKACAMTYCINYLAIDVFDLCRFVFWIYDRQYALSLALTSVYQRISA